MFKSRLGGGYKKYKCPPLLGLAREVRERRNSGSLYCDSARRFNYVSLPSFPISIIGLRLCTLHTQCSAALGLRVLTSKKFLI